MGVRGQRAQKDWGGQRGPHGAVLCGVDWMCTLRSARDPWARDRGGEPVPQRHSRFGAFGAKRIYASKVLARLRRGPQGDRGRKGRVPAKPPPPFRPPLPPLLIHHSPPPICENNAGAMTDSLNRLSSSRLLHWMPTSTGYSALRGGGGGLLCEPGAGNLRFTLPRTSGGSAQMLLQFCRQLV